MVSDNKFYRPIDKFYSNHVSLSQSDTANLLRRYGYNFSRAVCSKFRYVGDAHKAQVVFNEL